MQNIAVICDTLWDNYILIHNKFKKINSEHYRLHALYGKTLEIFNNCCTNNSLTLIRNYSDNLSKTIYNLLKIADIWLIFTNNIEYNTQARLVINKCEQYDIKYIIISEHDRNNDYYSFEIDKNLSFKKNLEKITKSSPLNITEFNDIIYNENYARNVNLSITLSREIKLKLKQSYNFNNKEKKEKSIKLLYDKNELKKEKEVKKNLKEVNKLNFSQNRLNYYKNKTNI